MKQSTHPNNMIYYAKAAIAVAITLFWVPASVYSQDAACLNDQDYTYDDDGKSRSCSNIRINEDRRQTLCQLDEVRSACPQSCGICCDDDPNYEFPMEMFPDKMRACSWITKNEDRTETRQANYCNLQDYDQATGTTIRNMCPKACDFCQKLVFVVSPPEPECQDDPDFTFTLTYLRTQVECEWITKNEDKIETRMAYCNDPEVKTGCPLTCGGCACEDDSNFEFELTNMPGEMRGCDWITKNEDKTATRQEKYCSGDVAENCPTACGQVLCIP